jgi:hypothetical protein
MVYVTNTKPKEPMARDKNLLTKTETANATTAVQQENATEPVAVRDKKTGMAADKARAMATAVVMGRAKATDTASVMVVQTRAMHRKNK